jgi:hypothetical protein
VVHGGASLMSTTQRKRNHERLTPWFTAEPA